MSNYRWLKTIGVALLLGLIITLTIVSVRGQGLQPVLPEDAKAIEAVIARSPEVVAIVNYSLDESGLAEVYINDPRGGELEEDELVLIQYIRQDKSLTLSEVGYLDFKQAQIVWRRQALEKQEAILATMQAEGREEMTPEETASLVNEDETGRSAISARRGADPATFTPYVHILSMEVQGEVATVVVDFGMFKAECILIKVEGRWYIAAQTLLEATG